MRLTGSDIFFLGEIVFYPDSIALILDCFPHSGYKVCLKRKKNLSYLADLTQIYFRISATC